MAKHFKRGRHELQNPAKESGKFRLLSNVCSFVTKKQSQKGEGHGTMPPHPLKYATVAATL